MEDSSQQKSLASQRASNPALIEDFGIEGLYSYRDISFSTKYAATILIAGNGSGKTTLLGALDAFLNLQFTRLRNLQFKKIVCKFHNRVIPLELTYETLSEFLTIPTDGELVRTALRFNVEAPALFDFLVEVWPGLTSPTRLSDSPKVYSQILQGIGYSYRDAAAICNKLYNELFARSPLLGEMADIVRAQMDGYDVVYLPTYRRVELALRSDEEVPPHRRTKPRFEVDPGSLFTGNIQFGLSDLSDRLKELNQMISRKSNNGYREISAGIINELIDGSFESAPVTQEEIPSRDALNLFFARLEQGRKDQPFGPVAIPNIDRIYNREEVPVASSKFLSYFLSKLGTAIKATRETELSVEDFVKSCNRYLSFEEASTFLKGTAPSEHQIHKGKALILNRADMRVHVQSHPGGPRIPLDALSSGEKQMVSLFAKIYLYPGRKIVLIDEPELSLSIDWQRQILLDVLTSPLCHQIVAITHSPFVFDNDLEPFAKALTTRSIQTTSVPSNVDEDSYE